MGVNGTIFMPETTPKQKINQVRLFGKSWVSVELCGDTFDAAYSAALAYSEKNSLFFIHPFNDPLVIAGQGTIGLELLEQSDSPIDVVLVPIGGGGLAAGLLTVLKQLSPQTKVIGVEPAGAASMKTALQQGKVTRVAAIDKFVDGAAVQCVGELTFEICKAHLDEIRTVPEGKV
jgi:threonine dehydratase